MTSRPLSHTHCPGAHLTQRHQPWHQQTCRHLQPLRARDDGALQSSLKLQRGYARPEKPGPACS